MSPPAKEQLEQFGHCEDRVVDQQVGRVRLYVCMQKQVLYLTGSKMSSYLLKLVTSHSLKLLGSRLLRLK